MSLPGVTACDHNLGTRAMPFGRKSLLSLLALALAGCDQPPAPQVAPSAEVAAEDQFSTNAPPTRAQDHAYWWREFNSAELNGLIEQMLDQNPDIAAASLRVLQSELTYANARNRAPLVSSGVKSTTNSSVANGSRDTTISGELSTSVSWEADLWGRIRNEGDAAAATLLATSYDRDALVSSLLGSVVKSYIGLNFTRRNIDATQRILATRQSNLAIAQERFRLGVENTDAGTVKSAEENLTATQADLPGLELEVITAINAIDALTGLIPSSRRSIQGILPGALPRLSASAGTPIQVLERRPDIQATMARLRAANANIAVSLADRFPTLTLSGSLKSSGEDLGQILDIDSLVASLVTDLTLTVFDGARGSRLVAIREAEAEEIAESYVSTVLAAIREVEDALTKEDLLTQQSALLSARLVTAREATTLFRSRYRDGTGTYLSLLDATRSEASAETAYLAAEQARWLNRVDLMLALGY